ncbi:MAG: hypothetical protein AB1758_24820, partial [Candidatus Eremiobacterota bacterium]
MPSFDRLAWTIGLTASGTLMVEVALTRIFSVIMFGHLSLVAVSMAMLGLTLGGLVVHFRPHLFQAERIARSVAYFATALAVTTVAALVYCLYVPFSASMDASGVLWVILWTLVLVIPFTCSGVVVCALLTGFPARSASLYAADLAGASLGCLGVVLLLNRLDAPTAILWVTVLLAMAGWVLGRHPRQALVVFLLVLLALVNTLNPVLRLQTVAGQPMDRSLAERELWNAFSYVWESKPMTGAALSGPGRNFDAEKAGRGRYRELRIDSGANTYMTEFHGDWEAVDWLLGDLCEFAHHLRSDGPVLVIGPGGGRDVLSAQIQARGQRDVTGVDVNPSMVRLVTELESEFSGGLQNLPATRFFVDEGRSWTQRTDLRFQVIAIPLVDTFAASSAGAYALTEHSLYTVEALCLFHSRLREDGLLSVARWYRRGKVGEVHRLAGMMAVALRRRGVLVPADHILVLADGRGALANLIMSARPLTPADLDRVRRKAERYGFDVLFSPDQHKESPVLSAGSADSLLAAIVSDPNWEQNCSQVPLLDLSPATDDRPFFFYTARPEMLWVNDPARTRGMDLSYKAPATLLSLLCIVVSLLLVLVLVVPPVLQARGLPPPGAWRASAYFTFVGAGFMLFEAGQIQRLTLFLGYPVYSLTVVLMALLLSSSVGSFLVGRLLERGRDVRDVCTGGLVGLMLALLGLWPVTEWLTQAFAGAHTPVRLALAVLCVAPAGLFLGTAVPLGLRTFGGVPGVSLPCAWAANGIASTAAAIYAIALSLLGGISL